MKRALVACLAAAVLLASAFSCATRQDVRFPHLRHVARSDCGEPGKPACPTCNGCHAAPARAPDAVAIPDAGACASCHHDADRLLHAATRGGPPEMDIVFSHGTHLARRPINGQCMGCHRGALAEDPAAASARPDMAQCLECHRADFDGARCARCHEPTDLPRALPTTFLSHATGWRRRHAALAGPNARICSQCHSQSYCSDCHDLTQTLPLEARRRGAIDRQLAHRGDFLSVHAVEARGNSTECSRCHSPASCDACHVDRGVSAARAGSVSPHPSGWLGRDVAARDFHGTAARRGILTCASCHDHGPATNCIPCHRVRGPAGNPHPGGWTSSRDQGSRPCRYCHGG